MMNPADPSSAAPPPRTVLADLPINLGQFLKLADLASTGGEAKIQISAGRVEVNGEIETRRGRHLAPGDAVRVDGGDIAMVDSVQPTDSTTDTQAAPPARGSR